MSDFASIMNEIKIPGFTREFFYFLSGFLFLLILNFLFKPDLNNYPNFYLFKGTLFGVALFTLSYFLSRACKEVGVSIVSILLFILQSNKNNKIKDYFTRFKSYIDGNEVTVTKRRSLLHDVEKFIFENDGLNFEYQRSIQYTMLVETFCGFFVILTIIYSFWMILPSLFCGLYVVHLHMQRFEGHVELGKHYEAVKKEHVQ